MRKQWNFFCSSSCATVLRSFVWLLLLWPIKGMTLPDGFVDIDDHIPGIVIELRYAGEDNFMGVPVEGYVCERAVLSEQATRALRNVQQDLIPFGLGLKIFDAYRPQRAVNHFVRWAQDVSDTRRKNQYYPDVDKNDLFKLDYIALRSGHSRGSTVDLTLVSRDDGKELDMGSGFDFFGVESWPDYPDIGAQQRANRLLLQQLMTKHGFLPYPREWWHFTLAQEPFRETYFDFVVCPASKASCD